MSESLRAPVYSKTLVGPDGKPAVIGFAPVVADPDASTTMLFLIPRLERPQDETPEEFARHFGRIDNVRLP